jgi:hypothetical protein
MANSYFDWPASLTRFVRFDGARAEEVNDALDSVSSGFEEVEVKTNAALKLPDGETATALGNSTARQGKVLTFNSSTGAPETVFNSADVATVAGIASDVDTVAGIAANVTSVAGNAANINTVAGISGNVTTVAGISGNVTSVVGNAANINAVAGNATNINAVAGNSANINSVAGNATNINSVVSNATNINSCATNMAAILNAPSQASAAASSANSAASLYDSFDDRYLGAKSSSPTTDNDGNTLLVGALYWDSVNKKMYTWDGANWDEWGSGAGATGGAGNAAFYENDITITADYTITTGKNAMSAGAITVNSGVTVTVPSGSTWSIVGS